jgi:hypothetical protein
LSIRDVKSVIDRLTNELGLSESEAETYVRALEVGRVESTDAAAIRSLLARGMLILSRDEKVYLAVHPRLALSNLFRSYQERRVAEMRDKRRMVDRLTSELVPIYERRRPS